MGCPALRSKSRPVYRVDTSGHTLTSPAQVNAYIWDANVGFNNILNDFQKYGFTDITHFGDALNDFWGNDFHPGCTSSPHVSM